MRRLSGVSWVVAVLLAVLLPLEQAHCLLMPLQARVNPAPCAAPAPDHSCCGPARAAQPQPTKSPDACPCIQLPAGTVPPAVDTNPKQVSSGLVGLTWTSLLAAPRAAAAPAPAPDIGSPPLPIACDAHGLRAPPLSA